MGNTFKVNNSFSCLDFEQENAGWDSVEIQVTLIKDILLNRIKHENIRYDTDLVIIGCF